MKRFVFCLGKSQCRGDVNNVLLISMMYSSIVQSCEGCLKENKSKLNNEETWWIQDECQACIQLLPYLLWGNQRLVEKNSTYYNNKRKAPHVHFPKGMEIRHPGWKKTAKALSDKSNGCCCWIEIHWITKCRLEMQNLPSCLFHHCAALYGSSSSLPLPCSPLLPITPLLPNTTSTLPYPLKEYCTH